MTQTTLEQEAALKTLIEQAQELDMGYGKDLTGLKPQKSQNHVHQALNPLRKAFMHLVKCVSFMGLSNFIRL